MTHQMTAEGLSCLSGEGLWMNWYADYSVSVWHLEMSNWIKPSCGNMDRKVNRTVGRERRVDVWPKRGSVCSQCV